jgi:hypothetical protein
VGEDVNECNHYGKHCGYSSKQLNIDLPYDPAIPLLGIYLKESAPRYNRATYTLMCVTAVFTIARLWK